MERSHGEEGVAGKCRKGKGHGLRYRPGPLLQSSGQCPCAVSVIQEKATTASTLQRLQTLGA